KKPNTERRRCRSKGQSPVLSPRSSVQLRPRHTPSGGDEPGGLIGEVGSGRAGSIRGGPGRASLRRAVAPSVTFVLDLPALCGIESSAHGPTELRARPLDPEFGPRHFHW